MINPIELPNDISRPPTRRYLRKIHIFLISAALAGIGAIHTPSLPSAQAANTFDTYDSIVKVDNCSASLIRFSHQKDTDPVLLLTNGHCYSTNFKNKEFISNKPINKTAGVFKGATPQLAGQIQLNRLVYASMTGTDVAIYRSNMTYKQLRTKFGLEARPVSATRPRAGTKIEIPSGYWSRTFSCSISSFIPTLKEGNWEWKDTVKYTKPGCEVLPGSSGSPVINPSNGQVIAINNTVNDSGQQCTLNNPCEIFSEQDIRVDRGAGYATQTYYLPACFQRSNLALKNTGCKLYKG